MTPKKFIAICTRLFIKYQLLFQRNLFSISSKSQKACALQPKPEYKDLFGTMFGFILTDKHIEKCWDFWSQVAKWSKTSSAKRKTEEVAIRRLKIA